LSDVDFDVLLTRDKPVIFAFHAYPWLIHRLASTNHNHIHVRGYKEQRSATAPSVTPLSPSSAIRPSSMVMSAASGRDSITTWMCLHGTLGGKPG
jgi:hypothetical protein